MSKNRKRITVGSLLIIVVGGTTLGLTRLPHPSRCNSHQLQRWLAKSDLASESDETLGALVDRFQDELESGLSADVEQLDLSPSLRSRVDFNIDLLQRLWFERRVDGYHQLSADKAKFLDRQIALIERWPGEGGDLLFFEKIERWVAQAEQLQQQAMNEALAAGIVRWLETYSLSGRSKEVREALAQRIDDYLSEGNQVGGFVAESSAQEKAQLRNNSDLLMRSWFGMQSSRFHNLPAGEQLTFVSRKISDLKKWDLQAIMGGGSSSANQFSVLAKKVDAWIDQADSTEQKLLRDFKNAVMQVVWKQFFSGSS